MKRLLNMLLIWVYPSAVILSYFFVHTIEDLLILIVYLCVTGLVVSVPAFFRWIKKKSTDDTKWSMLTSVGFFFGTELLIFFFRFPSHFLLKLLLFLFVLLFAGLGWYIWTSEFTKKEEEKDLFKKKK